jgi:RNA polymerase sigma factor (sigma-70 family)
MDKPSSDRELIVAYRAGDPQAATQLFDRYHSRLITLIRSQRGPLLKSVEESTDIAQSTLSRLFIQLQEKSEPVEPTHDLWPLLATIAINKIRNRGKFWQRERRDAVRIGLLDDSMDPLEHGPTPEDTALVDEIIEKLLAEFSERRQQIIKLILEGRMVREIAAEVEVSERTIFETRRAAAMVLAGIMAAE